MDSDGLQIIQNIFFIRGHTHTNRQFPYEYFPMDSCVDPYRKTMEFHMKNLHECAHFPYLGVKKRGEKKSIKPSHPKGFSIWSIVPSPPPPLRNFHIDSSMNSIGSLRKSIWKIFVGYWNPYGGWDGSKEKIILYLFRKSNFSLSPLLYRNILFFLNHGSSPNSSAILVSGRVLCVGLGRPILGESNFL
jgi:hypothetical protein